MAKTTVPPPCICGDSSSTPTRRAGVQPRTVNGGIDLLPRRRLSRDAVVDLSGPGSRAQPIPARQLRPGRGTVRLAAGPNRNGTALHSAFAMIGYRSVHYHTKFSCV